MYTPKHFEEKDRAKLIEFMRQFNFASVVNKTKKRYWATHLPFLISEKNGEILLRAHMAKANPQWVNFKNDEEVLVIFQEPHAYISTELYETSISVPTWNYIAVHAYGTPRILSSREDKIKILEDSFAEFQPSYQKQWEQLPEKYREDLLNGITAFKINVTDIEGKFKLSQNRTKNERGNIISYLSKSEDKSKSDIAMYMDRTKQSDNTL